MKRILVLDTTDKTVTPIGQYLKELTYDEIACTPMLIRANIFQKLPCCKKTNWRFTEYGGGLLPEIWIKIFNLIPGARGAKVIPKTPSIYGLETITPLKNDYGRDEFDFDLWWLDYWASYVKTCEEKDFYYFLRPQNEHFNVQLCACKNCDVSKGKLDIL